MAQQLNPGLTRIGILLSAVWLIIVGCLVAHENQRDYTVCSMSDVTAEHLCHQFFWRWEPGDASSAAKDQNQKKEPDVHIHLGKLRIDMGASQPVVHKLDVPHLVLAVVGGLGVLWGLALGVGWCVAGFRKPAA